MIALYIFLSVLGILMLGAIALVFGTLVILFMLLYEETRIEEEERDNEQTKS